MSMVPGEGARTSAAALDRLSTNESIPGVSMRVSMPSKGIGDRTIEGMMENKASMNWDLNTVGSKSVLRTTVPPSERCCY